MGRTLLWSPCVTKCSSRGLAGPWLNISWVKLVLSPQPLAYPPKFSIPCYSISLHPRDLSCHPSWDLSSQLEPQLSSSHSSHIQSPQPLVGVGVALGSFRGELIQQPQGHPFMYICCTNIFFVCMIWKSLGSIALQDKIRTPIKTVPNMTPADFWL